MAISKNQIASSDIGSNHMLNKNILLEVKNEIKMRWKLSMKSIKTELITQSIHSY